MFVGDFGSGEGIGFGFGGVAIAGDHTDDFFDHVAGLAAAADVNVNF